MLYESTTQLSQIQAPTMRSRHNYSYLGLLIFIAGFDESLHHSTRSGMHLFTCCEGHKSPRPPHCQTCMPFTPLPAFLQAIPLVAARFHDRDAIGCMEGCARTITTVQRCTRRPCAPSYLDPNECNDLQLSFRGRGRAFHLAPLAK